MSPSEKFFLFAGEPSGDLHGGRLLEALQQQFPKAAFEGVGGPDMRARGIKNHLAMEDFAVMGFSDVIKSFPRLWRQFHFVKKCILEGKPNAVVLIDYPGFNLRLAKHLRKNGYKGKIIQYISPTVWAWGKKRIPLMAQTLDQLMTIYPFEKACFASTSLKVDFVGHPLPESILAYQYQTNWKEEVGIPRDRPIISIFPGSRMGEITRNLPKQLAAAELFQKQYPESVFAISYANEAIRLQILKLCERTNLKFHLVSKKYLYEMMKDSRAAIAKSGTVTLELALHGCPTVVVYVLTTLNRLIAKYLIRLNLPHYCMVNILCQKTVFPELIASGFDVQNLAAHLSKLYQEGSIRKDCMDECKKVHNLLYVENSSWKVAKYIQELMT